MSEVIIKDFLDTDSLSAAVEKIESECAPFKKNVRLISNSEYIQMQEKLAAVLALLGKCRMPANAEPMRTLNGLKLTLSNKISFIDGSRKKYFSDEIEKDALEEIKKRELDGLKVQLDEIDNKEDDGIVITAHNCSQWRVFKVKEKEFNFNEWFRDKLNLMRNSLNSLSKHLRSVGGANILSDVSEAYQLYKKIETIIKQAQGIELRPGFSIAGLDTGDNSLLALSGKAKELQKMKFPLAKFDFSPKGAGSRFANAIDYRYFKRAEEAIKEFYEAVVKAEELRKDQSTEKFLGLCARIREAGEKAQGKYKDDAPAVIPMEKLPPLGERELIEKYLQEKLQPLYQGNNGQTPGERAILDTYADARALCTE